MSSSSSAPREVIVREEPIELCQLLKFGGLAATGGEAKQLISQGLVSLNAAVETRKRRKVHAGDVVSYRDDAVVVRVAGGSTGTAR